MQEFITKIIDKKQRVYGLGIWALGLGYFLFYTPYSGFTNALSAGLLSSGGTPLRGAVLLPVSIAAVTIGMLGFITAKQWWKYAGHREILGISIPFPRWSTFLSGVCMATIMATTTLALALEGVSIVLVLVLLRGGVLIISPIVDAMVKRRVRWFAWAAMLISLMAVLVVLNDSANYKLSETAVVIIAAYLTAYFIRFQLMSRLAKTDEKGATLCYFVEEQMVASPVLLLALGAMAIMGIDAVRSGFTTFLVSGDAIFALLVGLFYAGLCICTTLIFLDRRENTFCIPMHCSSSMLAGLAATYALSFAFHRAPPTVSQLISAGLLIMALAFLSPLHHFQRSMAKLKSVLSGWHQWLNGFGRSSEMQGPVILRPEASLTRKELEN